MHLETWSGIGQTKELALIHWLKLLILVSPWRGSVCGPRIFGWLRQTCLVMWCGTTRMEEQTWIRLVRWLRRLMGDLPLLVTQVSFAMKFGWSKPNPMGI